MEKMSMNNDELDIKEFLAIIVREKMTVIVTFVVIALLSLGVALYLRDKGKKAVTILNLPNKESRVIDPMPNKVLNQLYKEYDIKIKEDLTLDEFKDRFKIEGIVPKSIKLKQEALEKQGEVLKYIPTNYIVSLRVGTPEESKEILNEYVEKLNKNLEYKNINNHRYRVIDRDLLTNSSYDYQDYLGIIGERVSIIKEDLSSKFKNSSDFNSYGTKVRNIKIEMDILQNIAIPQLQNYLETKGIVKNIETFTDGYTNRLQKLNTLLKEKEYKKEYLEKAIQRFKVENETQLLSKDMKEIKITSTNDAREKKYVEMVDQYIKAQKELGDIQKEILKLETLNKNLKAGNEDEKQFIDESLNSIMVQYNYIVKGMNELIEKQNSIKYEMMAKKMNPVVIISESKAKLVLAVGVVIGLFLGVMMAFVKDFLSDFKKYLSVMILFLVLGLNSYSEEIVNISVTQKNIKNGLNLDGTPFDMKKEIYQFLDSKKIDISKTNISVEPIIKSSLVKKEFEKVKSNIESEKESSAFVPTEYQIVLAGDNEKEIANILSKEFNKFYTESDKPKMEIFIFNDGDFNVDLKEMKIVINELRDDVKARMSNVDTKYRAEFNSILLSLDRLENIYVRDLSNYIYSNCFVENLKESDAFLLGEKNDILREKVKLKERAETLSKVIDSYKSPTMEVEKDSVRDKQYVELSAKYLEVQNAINELNTREETVDLLLKKMKTPNEVEKKKIDSYLTTISKEINKINEEIYKVLLDDFR